MEQLIGQTQKPAGSYVKDSDTARFATDVLDASMQQPVIVDFWAPWCGPCKQLGPLLEQQVNAAKGAVRLVKINVDENQQLAAQFRVQSIPAVYAFAQGRPVDGFMGAQPESQVKAFVQRLAKMSGDGGAQAMLDEALAHADELLRQGDSAQAAAIYRELIAHDPSLRAASAGLLRCFIAAQDFAQAKSFAAQMDAETRKDAKIAAALTELDLAEKGRAQRGAIPGLEARLAADAGDHEARFALAELLFANGAREQALDHLLELVRRNRQWNDEAARRQLVTFFEVLGPTDPLTLAGRRKLSSLLFS
ncbi:MAG TPA: thioredoxin [Dongiaceae bacterium]|jgi:putative thioredoxin|nr:thioredoxin [Dongiaceae bacterium]